MLIKPVEWDKRIRMVNLWSTHNLSIIGRNLEHSFKTYLKHNSNRPRARPPLNIPALFKA